MARLLATLSALAAVIGGVGTGLAWTTKHVPPTIAVFIGLAIGASATAFAIHMMGRPGTRYYDTDKWLLVILGTVAAQIILFFGLIVYAPKNWEYVMAYVLVAAGAVPNAWVAYRLDADAHWPCPDCCERIKKAARVCRHCGNEFWPRPSTPMHASSEPPPGRARCGGLSG